jgi:hypothetical protein
MWAEQTFRFARFYAIFVMHMLYHVVDLIGGGICGTWKQIRISLFQHKYLVVTTKYVVISKEGKLSHFLNNNSQLVMFYYDRHIE